MLGAEEMIGRWFLLFHLGLLFLFFFVLFWDGGGGPAGRRAEV